MIYTTSQIHHVMTQWPGCICKLHTRTLW